MPGQSAPSAVATIGIDIGKNTFHLVGFDQRGAIVLKLKSTREQLERRLANLPRCLIGMEACSGSLEPRLIATMFIVQRIAEAIRSLGIVTDSWVDLRAGKTAKI
jgi:hypothetical protein